MARITIEDCLKKVGSRFELVHLTAQRVRQIREGSEYLVSSPKNEDIVVALREIAAGKVTQESIDAAGDLFMDDVEDIFSAPATNPDITDIFNEKGGAVLDQADDEDETDNTAADDDDDELGDEDAVDDENEDEVF